MYLVTGLLSEVLTNNAAAALTYPIAASVGDDMGVGWCWSGGQAGVALDGAGLGRVGRVMHTKLVQQVGRRHG